MSHDWLEAIAAAISAILALVATVVSIIAIRRQDELGRQQQDLEATLADQHDKLDLKLAAEKSEFDAKLAAQREDFDRELARTERLYSQRSALFDLWKYISQLSAIAPAQPVTPDIMQGTQTLELVALCCEASIVDLDLVRRTFRQSYVDLYEQIEQVVDVPGLNKSGKRLLGENPAAMKLYQQFKTEIMHQGALTPIGA